MARFCQLTSPLGADLLFSGMRVSERLSRLYEIDLEAVSQRDDIDPKKILGYRVNIKIDHGDGVIRFYDGFVTQFAHGGAEGRRYKYRMQVRPALWFLTRTTDCRVYQHMTIPKILEQVLLEGRNRTIQIVQRYLDPTVYKTWEYCVQYRETDFSFVSRLMELEGIYYFFEHTSNGHTLVLTDDKSKHVPLPGLDTFAYVPGSRQQVHRKDVITEWRQIQEVLPGRFTIKDYDWLKPASQQMVSRSPENTHEHGQASAQYEIFDFPGDFDPVDGQALAQGDPYVSARAEEQSSQAIVFRGAGMLRGFHVGQRFKLADHPRRDQNGEYLIVGTDYEYRDSELESGDQAGSRYDCAFTALPQRQQFRAPRVTHRPLIHGLQSAVVTGPAGEEIFTDKHGRIKVQFHWDRHGGRDENSSCFLRVSSLAAGNNWGFISIPRIGHEVLVSFMEGDPDRPVVTGVVYNGSNPPPWALPDNKTQWGMLSRSSKGGGLANANALRFEDKKGSEQVWLHAEKNQDIEVENDETHWVGHDRTKTIGHDERTHVKHDRTEIVGNNESITVQANRTENVVLNEKLAVGVNRDHAVGASESLTVAIQRTHTVGVNEVISVGAAQIITIGGAQVLTVGGAQALTVGGPQTLTVGENQNQAVGGDLETAVGGKATMEVAQAFTLNAGDEITLQTGAASIVLKKDGTIDIKGVTITIEASAMLNLKAAGIIDIKGAMVKINS